MSEKLPRGWQWAKIEDVVADMTGGCSTKKDDYIQQGVLVLNKGNIAPKGKVKVPEPKKYVTNLYAEKNSDKVIQTGSILVTLRDLSVKADFLGLIARYEGFEKALITQGMYSLKISTLIDENLFIYFSNSPYYRDHVKSIKVGTTQVHLRNGQFLSIPFPIAPLVEQKRIVEKLDCLLAKVNACKARLDKVLIIIKRFRQSVLADAVSGNLTEDWRAENSCTDSARELLISTKEYRENAYKDAVLSAETSGYRKPRPFRINEVVINSQELPNIPKGWVWERLINISNIQGGVTKGRKLGNKRTISLPYLRVANVQDGFLNLKKIKNIDVLPEDKDKYKLLPGDILFTEGGDRDKLGRGTIWRDEIENCIHQNHIFRARLYCPNILSNYISIATKSENARNYFFDNANQTVNLASINMTTLGNVPIPLPPEKEQIEIFRRVDALFSIADQFEDKIKTATQRLNSLASSILSKAFRGELVPQDPTDEPAELLIQRIVEEREALVDNKKGRERKPKKEAGQGRKIKSKKADSDAETELTLKAQVKTNVNEEKAIIVRSTKQRVDKIDKRFEKTEVLQAFRKSIFRQNDIDEYQLLRLVGQRLGARRLSKRIRLELESYIRAAIRRKIIISNGDSYGSATPTINHYDDEYLIKVIKSVIRKGYEYERGEVVAEAAGYLGFDNVSNAFAERIKTVFRKAIRRGDIYRNGIYVGKV